MIELHFTIAECVVGYWLHPLCHPVPTGDFYDDD